MSGATGRLLGSGAGESSSLSLSLGAKGLLTGGCGSGTAKAKPSCACDCVAGAATGWLAETIQPPVRATGAARLAGGGTSSGLMAAASSNPATTAPEINQVSAASFRETKSKSHLSQERPKRHEHQDSNALLWKLYSHGGGDGRRLRP